MTEVHYIHTITHDYQYQLRPPSRSSRTCWRTSLTRAGCTCGSVPSAPTAYRPHRRAVVPDSPTAVLSPLGEGGGVDVGLKMAHRGKIEKDGFMCEVLMLRCVRHSHSTHTHQHPVLTRQGAVISGMNSGMCYILTQSVPVSASSNTTDSPKQRAHML